MSLLCNRISASLPIPWARSKMKGYEMIRCLSALKTLVSEDFWRAGPAERPPDKWLVDLDHRGQKWIGVGTVG